MTDQEIQTMLRLIRRWGIWAALGVGAQVVDAPLIVVLVIACVMFQDRG